MLYKPRMLISRSLESWVAQIMGRESNDPIAIQSSIALLQERFRQLQRVKEMREERELHRMLVQPAIPYEPSGLFFHFLPAPRSSSSPQVSLSLGPNSQTKYAGHDLQCMETPLLMGLQQTETPSMHTSSDSNHDDVDTSLHL